MTRAAAAMFLTLLTCLQLVHVGFTVSIEASSMQDEIQKLKTAMEKQQTTLHKVTEQLMAQQFYVEEKTRSDGDSGIKQIRVIQDGTKPYFVPAISERDALALHDRSALVNTAGLREFVAVLNGIEFRTRHVDYVPRRRTLSGGKLDSFETMPFPDVPQAVLSKPTIEEQIMEMREWFKAWQEGNTTVRNYTQHFHPVLCYLEGAWTLPEGQAVEEPVVSVDHHIAANTWQEQYDNIRFTSYTGDKDKKENYAYLPRTVMNVTEDGTPVFAQWNYDVLCHKINMDFTLRNLKPVDNLQGRLTNDYDYGTYIKRKAARFTITDARSGENEQFPRWHYLDRLMMEVPGMDGYTANLTDQTYEVLKLNPYTDQPLNTGFYHRWYKLGTDRNRFDRVIRGFSDRNLFVAETTNPRVFPVQAERCNFPDDLPGQPCTRYEQRVTYAIPLELMWLTPLHMWNPHGLQYKGDADLPLGQTVTANDRDGGLTEEKAFNGTNSLKFFQTPDEFFNSTEKEAAIGKTAFNPHGVLDPQGKMHKVRASGFHIFLPGIGDMGELRTRYPVAPVHAEGSAVWKEMEAVRDVVMDMGKYSKYFKVSPPFRKA